MAKSAFNLTARINMAGPYYMRPVISKIKKQLSSIKPDLNFKLNKSAAQNIKKITAEVKSLGVAAQKTNIQVKKLNTNLVGVASAFNSALSGARSLNAGLNSTNSRVNKTTSLVEKMGKESGKAIKRFLGFSSVTAVVYSFTNAVSDGYKEFLNFNKELVKLSQVTNKSVSDLSGISDEITRLSSNLGVASSSLIGVASTLAQAGLSAEETKTALESLAKSSLAPSFDDIASTGEGAIAIMRQFGLSASDLDSAIGSVNAVAKTFAVEARDIIAAVQRTGGVFAASSRGVSQGKDALNEFIAIFTSVRQTTRESAETIATGLRTIFTRIQRSSTIDLLKKYGIELRNTEGQFVGTYEAVRRLSEGLRDINPRSADFAAISEELGGFRQIGKVIPLIQQFSVAQEAYNVAVQGSDSLSKDAIAAQQSLSIQFEKTRQNFLALIREIGDTSSFQTFVGSVLSLTNGVIELGRALKPLLPALSLLGTLKLAQSIPLLGAGVSSIFTRRNEGGPIRKFARGGIVPGVGNTDSVEARLQPGEFVIRKDAVNAIGRDNLYKMNRYAQGGEVEKQILSNSLKSDSRYHFGLVGLRSGTKSATVPSEDFKVTAGKGKNKSTYDVTLHRSVLSQKLQKAVDQRIEKDIISKFQSSVESTGKILSKELGGAPTEQSMKNAIEGNAKYAVIGSIFEAGLTSIGAPYIEKGEKTKSIDFPLGLGNIASKFNIDPNIPTDATRTIGGKGKTSYGMKNQIRRFFTAIKNNEFTKFEQKQKNKKTISNLPQTAYTPEAIRNKLANTRRINPNNPVVQKVDAALNKFGRQILSNRTRKTAAKKIQTNEDQVIFDDGISAIQDLMRAKATGGYHQDTVHALLTPGEFVINKESASRIGSRNLNKLNQADKLPGFNRGGFVGSAPQKFARGGSVDPLLLAGGGVLTLALGELKQFTDSLKQAKDSANDFSASFAEFIQSGISQTISTIGVSKLIGLSQSKSVALGLASGITGAVGGAIQENTARKIERALLGNTKLLNTFQKNLTDITEASDPETRIQAQKDLQASFAQLTYGIQNSVESIRSLENLQKVSTGVETALGSVINTITAFTLLSTVTSKAARVVEIFGSAAKFGTKLLASLNPYVAVIGGVVAAGTALLAVFNSYTAAASKTNEQFDRLNKALDETIKNSIDFSLSNNRFVSQVLPQFQQLVERSQKTNSPRSTLQNLVSRESGLSELRLGFRTVLRTNLMNAGYNIGSDQSISEFRQSLNDTAEISEEYKNTFDKIVKETENYLTRQDYINALVEKSGYDRADAEKKYASLVSSGLFVEINRVSKNYRAAKDLEILQSRNLAKNMDKLKIAFNNFYPVLTKFTNTIDKATNDLVTSFKDLTISTDIALGSGQLTFGSNREQQLYQLKNLQSISVNDRDKLINSILGPLQTTGRRTSLRDDQKILSDKIRQDVQAYAILQKQLPTILSDLSNSVEIDLKEYLDNNLRPLLQANLGNKPGTEPLIGSLLNTIEAALIEARGQGKSILSISDLESANTGFKTVTNNMKDSIKILNTVIQNNIDADKALTEAKEKTYQLDKKILDLQLKKVQSDAEVSRTLSEIFDQNISFQDKISPFVKEISQLTGGIGINKQGIDVNAIATAYNSTIQKIEQNRAKRSSAAAPNDILNLSMELLDLQNEASKFVEALNKLSDSSEQVQLAFDEISKSRNLFKTRLGVGLDIISQASKNPMKALELQYQAQQFGNVINGLGSFTDILSVLDNNAFLSLFKNPDAIREQLASNLAITAGDVPGAEFFRTFIEDGRSLANETNQLQEILKSKNAANIQLQTIYNTELKRVHDGIITEYDRFLQSFQTFGQREFIPSQFKSIPRSDVLSKTAVNSLLSSINDRANKVANSDYNRELFVGPDLMTTMPMSASRSNIFEAANAENPLTLLSRQIAEQASTGGLSLNEFQKMINTTQKSLTDFENAMSKRWFLPSGYNNMESIQTELNAIRKFTDELLQKARTASEITPSPAPATRNVAPQQFGINQQNLKPIDDLNKILSGNNDFNGLAASIDQFKPLAKTLSDSINTLVQNFPNGVMTAKVDQSADVNISFNEALSVDSANELGNKAMRDIESIVERQIASKIRPILNAIQG